ncbi:MAG TPA: DUF4180 domain-containing protein [Blastocatellia bacterium]|nr:DUF4180 domain-containing protein [Blastocatellia bacterium]
MSNQKVLLASDLGIAIGSFNDISDAIGTCLGAKGLILTESDLSPEFFDLRTRIAGELFQKFTNYQVRLAIVLADPGAYGERFSELAYEHRAHPTVQFFQGESEAARWLSDSN